MVTHQVLPGIADFKYIYGNTSEDVSTKLRQLFTELFAWQAMSFKLSDKAIREFAADVPELAADVIFWFRERKGGTISFPFGIFPTCRFHSRKSCLYKSVL